MMEDYLLKWPGWETRQGNLWKGLDPMGRARCGYQDLKETILLKDNKDHILLNKKGGKKYWVWLKEINPKDCHYLVHKRLNY